MTTTVEQKHPPSQETTRSRSLQFKTILRYGLIGIVALALLIQVVYAWYAALVTGLLATVALVIGLILALTGLVGWCPLYALFGMSTRPSQQ